MKKWDDDFRMKSYVNKIQNAKSTVPNNQRRSIKKRTIRDTEFSSHASYRSDYNDIKESVLYKQLTEFNLQQYANKLLLRGYISGLQQLAQQPYESQNIVLLEIKLLPGHKEKFMGLFKYLNEHYDPHNYILTPNNQRQNRNTLPGQQNSHGKFEQTNIYMEVLRPANRRASLKHFSPNQDLGIIKPRQLPKLDKQKFKVHVSKNEQFEEVLSKNQELTTYQETMHGSQLSIKEPPIVKPLSKTINHPIVKIKQTKKKKSLLKSSKDNKILKKLISINSKNTDDINLQLDQVSLMYQSFDNGKLASTLINIDIEEISYCVGSTLQKMIQSIDQEELDYLENEIFEMQQEIFRDEYPEEIQTSNDRVTEQFRYDNEVLDEQTFEMSKADETVCQQYLHEAIIEPEITDPYDDGAAAEEVQQFEQTEQSQAESNNNLQLSKSYFSVDTTYNLEDYLLFFKVFTDKSISNYIPNVDIIQNYCKNIMITTKMEREVAIISMIYINRLLDYNQGIKITCLNWQKLLFTALVMSSKIWDDESFENNNFAKVLPHFTTIQINEMEKVFLKLIEYNLYVNSGEYAKQYFILRAYADKKQRSFPLKQLDISTVLRLQKGGEQDIKKQQYQNPLNKSF